MPNNNRANDGFGFLAKLELMRAACGLKLPSYATRALIALISLINEKSGLAFPPRSLLSRMTNIEERNVGRALRGLKQRGLIEVAIEGTKRRSTRYRVDANAVLAGCGVSSDRSDGSLETEQGSVETDRGSPAIDHIGLYKHITSVANDQSQVSLETPEEQRRGKQAQAKRQRKCSAVSGGSLGGSLPRGRSLASPRGGRLPRRQPKHAWLANYLPAERAE
ncbi:MAG: hypothetical protein JOY71_29485 [Acetobacteraceae bacterium]|nr:hypothetical protein [Acetobacteraceae bacterium]